jgi:hypothetical protein
MRYERNHHIDVIRTLAKDRGWSKHKVKSIRGQILSMATFEERELYLKKLIARKA